MKAKEPIERLAVCTQEEEINDPKTIFKGIGSNLQSEWTGVNGIFRHNCTLLTIVELGASAARSTDGWASISNACSSVNIYVENSL